MDHFLQVTREAAARLPANAGLFEIMLFDNRRDGKEHIAVVAGDVSGQEDVMVRVHSECFTGDVLGSRRCDCGEQLDTALHMIAQAGRGVVVYLRQEGRGIGLKSKLRAYNLQDDGYDTVEANVMLGHAPDEREYSTAAGILNDLGIKSIQLITNNPEKVEQLDEIGIKISGRVPITPRVHADNEAYLATKVTRMRHLLKLDQPNGASASNLADKHSGDGQNGAEPSLAKGKKSSKKRDRPFVTLTYAQSLDGSIATRAGEQTTISCSSTKKMTHQLRADHDSILVGVETILSDNPCLTTRLANGKNPTPIILDSTLRTPVTAKVISAGQNPIIFTTDAAPIENQTLLSAAGAIIHRLPADKNGLVPIPAMLDVLAKSEFKRLMVEGGSHVITTFLTEQSVDRIILTMSMSMIGGLHAVRPNTNRVPMPSLSQATSRWVGEDMVIEGIPVWPED